MAAIEKRISDTGITTFRVKVRVKGVPTQSATFQRLTDAKDWAKITEGAIKDRRYFKNTEAKKRTLGNLIDRYIDDVLPQKPKSEAKQKSQLLWWKAKLGAYYLIDLTPSLIAEQRDKLAKEKSRLGQKYSPATINRYLAALSHAFTVAVNDWAWLDDSPSLRGRDIREAFKDEDCKILLVANKFQTGFDQPLLCGMYVDKRLAGIQAVQTLSRLNRAHSGKDTTYVIDFANDTADILDAFKTYYTTAELSATTDPNLVFDLRSKLDTAGHYDDFEVERVVEIELNPNAKQSELINALEPVSDRVTKRYKAAQEALNAAKAREDVAATEIAQNELNSLVLFKGDLGAYLRLYTFLSQIFDYGNTAIEKRAIFYKRLLPLLEFGREREGIDLSKVVLTHHNLKNLGKRAMPLNKGENPKLNPITESGSGSVQEKEKSLLNEIIEKVNDLFDGDLTDQDKLVYVNNVIKGKLLESEKLQQQAANNSKEQFANSPDLKAELMSAIIGALDAHTAMSTQALDSEIVRMGLQDVLLNQARLYETLREKSKD